MRSTGCLPARKKTGNNHKPLDKSHISLIPARTNPDDLCERIIELTRKNSKKLQNTTGQWVKYREMELMITSANIFFCVCDWGLIREFNAF